VWDDPVRPVSEQTGNIFVLMLFYECTVAGEGDVVVEGVQEGDDHTETSDTPEKTISISSGTEESSDEQVPAHEEDSDDGEVSDEEADSEEDTSKDEEEFHIDYGYGPANAEVLATQARKHLESRDEDSFDDELDSEFSVDTDDLDPNYVFGELDPEAKAQEIAAVYQDVAELVTGDAKKELLANAQRVLVAGSMLARSLQKQEQGDDYKASAKSSDEEMLGQLKQGGQTSGSRNMLQIFKGMTAHAKGICLAQGTENASLILEEDLHKRDNVDIARIRKLHLYTGRAMMLSKQLHEVDSPPQDRKPTFFEEIPSRRGRNRGLRLGSCYRRFGKLLLDMKDTDNMSDIFNIYLCGSWVTEMGFALDDLWVESSRVPYIIAGFKARWDTEKNALETQKSTLQSRNNTLQIQKKVLAIQNLELKSYKFILGSQNKTLQAVVKQLQAQLRALKIEKTAAKRDVSALKSHKFILESRNDTLQAQVNQLQAQLDALKFKKAAAKPNLSALSGPELFELMKSVMQETRKNLVPEQATTGDSHQTRIYTSDTLMGRVTSEAPTRQEKQEVDMAGTASSPHAGMLPDTPVNDSKPDPMTKNDHSAPPLSKAVGSTKNASSKQPKRGFPGFMSPTAAVAAKSRPPVSKPGAIAAAGTRPHTRR
jgi:competence protein ComGC